MPSRRQFLLGLIASAAVVGTWKSTASAFSGEAGRSIFVTASDYKLCKKLLIEDAMKNLPRGTIFEIRMPPPTDYGRTHQMAWYASEEMQQLAVMPMADFVFQPHQGVLLGGRYINATH